MKIFFNVFSIFISIFISFPIWFYLLYKILIKVEATELMMFLFWIYVPITFISTLVLKILEGNIEE